MKNRKDLKKERISGKGEIFIEGDYVGKIKKVGKIKFGFIKYNMGLSSDEFRLLADMMDKK